MMVRRKSGAAQFRRLLRVGRGYARATSASPAEYWEARAHDLVEAYDQRDTWKERGWPDDELERRVVPQVLCDLGVRSVLVIGAGSGRQYEFLAPRGFALSGFDISPTLVATCRERYPHIQTDVDDLVHPSVLREPADAAYSAHVLQHIGPEKIEQAAESLARLARSVIVIREATALRSASSYQWAHDYERLFATWRLVNRMATDETVPYRAEIMVWRRA